MSLQDDPGAAIDRQQDAQSFVLPEMAFYDDVGESPSYQPAPEFAMPRDRKPAASTAIASLEDLYAAFPEIGKGDWKLRITRFEPKSFRGHQTAGFLCELYDRISLEEFRNRFGGGVYQVLVMKPTSEK